MLPRVDAQQGNEAAGDGVLVCAGDEGEGARRGVLGEPGPAGALDAGKGGVELLDQGLGGAKVLLNGGLHGLASEARKQMSKGTNERGEKNIP